MIITKSSAADSSAQADRLVTTRSAVSNIWVNSRKQAGLLAASFIFCSLPVFAQTVPLGTASGFGVIAAQAITSTGATIITGDLGITPSNASSVTGFSFSTPPGPGIVTGTPHFADAVAVTAKNDAQAAYITLASRPCTTTISGDLGGRTLTPGVYCSASSMGLTGTLTLDALGDSNAVFIFQIGSTLTTASASQVRMINGGQNCNIFWQIGSSATMGTGSSFLGNVIASSSVTMTTGTSSTGRLIALNGAVTLDGSNVTVCALAPGNPSISKSFSPSTINAGAMSVLTVTLINPNPTVATLNAPLTDTLPVGVVIANPPNASKTCGGSGVPSAVAGGNSVSLGAGATIPANGTCSLSVSVTAAATGIYLNTVNAGALVTSNGNNTSPAQATLTVIAIINPLVSKSFSPSAINAGASSVLTVTLTNPNPTVATLNAPLIDTLPLGVVVANPPNTRTTCGGTGLPSAVAGGNSVSLGAGATIPANGSCSLSASVTAAAIGVYLNTVNAGALVTSNGNNVAPAQATLTVTLVVVPPTVPSVGVPTLSTWALLMSVLLLLVVGVMAQRRSMR